MIASSTKNSGLLQISKRSKNGKLSSKYTLLLAFTFIFIPFVLVAQVAPVNIPTGGFAIDGGLRSNTPTSPSPFAINQGDWYPGMGGTGGSVFKVDGSAFDPTTSGRAADAYTSNDDIFTSGSKFNDYISDLRWFTNSAPDKNDINNALYHIDRDANNNQWAFMAGDRKSINGTSYIDFEFLQGSVTKNANGTFTGIPLANKANGGGRTEGDIIVSMEYTNGGTKPIVVVYQWKLTNGTWSFQPINLNDDAFAETNRTTEANLPYTAFGNSSYPAFAFVEAAINITKLLDKTSQACAELSIKTLWIKTKASASSTAALKDFMDPIPVDFEFGNTSIDDFGPYCVNDNTAVTLTATPGGGTFSGPGVTNNKFTPSAAGVGTHTINYTSADGSCTASTTITVHPTPTADAGDNPTAQCQNSNGNLFNLSGSVTNGNASWSVVDNPNNLGVSFGNTNTASTSVTITGGVGSVILRLTSTSQTTPSCGTATDDVIVTVYPNPIANAGADPAAQCYVAAGNTFALDGSASLNGTALWTVESKPANWTVEFLNNSSTSLTPSVKVTGAGTGGKVVLKLTITSANCGSASDFAEVEILAQPAGPMAEIEPITCNDRTFKLRIISPVAGVTYKLSQPGNSKTFTDITATDDGQGNVNPVIFEGLEFGDGYSVIASQGTCQSAPNTCAAGPAEESKTVIQESNKVTGQINKISTQDIKLEGKTSTVTASPNPFSNKIQFNLTSNISGQASLELYDVLGQKVKTVYRGYMVKGQTQTVEYNVPGTLHTNLIWVFRVGNERSTGKLIGLK